MITPKWGYFNQELLIYTLIKKCGIIGNHMVSDNRSAKGEAQAAIVRGFLDTSIMGLPRELQKEVDIAISTCGKEAF